MVDKNIVKGNTQVWRIPNSLKDSNVSPSERQWKGEESRHAP